MSRHLLKMKRPASWHGESWREALFLGNGLTGVLMHGAIAEETLQFARHDLWHKGNPGGEIPNITDTFAEMRRKLQSGDYLGANTNMLAAALLEKGYASHPEVPCPLGSLKIFYTPDQLFQKYERTLDMRSSEGSVRYQVGENHFERRCFVSRDSDLTVLSVRADCPFTSAYTFSLYPDPEAACDYTPSSFSCRSADGTLGARVFFSGEFSSEIADNKLYITGKEYLVLIQVHAHHGPSDISAELIRSYEELLDRHRRLHTPLYDAVSMELASEEEHTITNERLLEDAYDTVASPVLLEKLWRFGRYLFISASSDTGNPVCLYGIWPGQDDLPWCQYVANENVQMTYWHVLSGGLAHSLKPLIRYYTDKLDTFRSCARNIFGMNGIWVSAYTSPGVSGPSVPVGVIFNWISSGGWLCQHFWDYYLYTGDEETLKDQILPFMREVALFYQDYVTFDENGRMQICPSVSPENTPGNFIPEYYREDMGHPAPAVKNATMDFAVMKELLTHLLQGMEKTGFYASEAETYQALLDRIPPYMINEDGAVKEWMSPELRDNYYHRHLSHLYPVFPGNEINSQNDPELFSSFRQAVNLRELGGQSGWSLAHMANIYARMGEGEKAVDCLDLLSKSVLNTALITTHNDWRHMGMTIDLGDFAPVQLDANFGTVSALQEMLFRYGDGRLFLLPALPERLKSGTVRGLVFPFGTADICWNEETVSFTLRAEKDFTADIILKEKYLRTVTLKAGEVL